MVLLGGILVHQLAAAITFWAINQALSNDLSFLACLLFSLPMLPASVLVAIRQTEWRYSLTPLPAANVFRKTVPASFVMLTVVCLPFIVLFPFHSLIVFLPLVAGGLVAGVAHLMFVEVMRDQFPPSGGRRSDGY